MKHRRDFTRAYWVSVYVCLISLLHGLQAQELPKIAENHPWATFNVGSWKRVRTLQESVGTDGQVQQTSMSDTKTTLTQVTDTGYTLKVERTVELAGRRFPAEPKLIYQGFHGETNGQVVQVQPAGAGELEIDGKKFAIEKSQVVINGDDQKRTMLVHYNDRMSPYVLKRETKAVDAVGGRPSYESTVDVVAVAMPYRVLTDTKIVSLLKTTNKQASGATTVTLEIHCDDVPGGIVAHSAKELNAQDKIVSRSTLELVEYNIEPSAMTTESVPAGRRRVFHRNRSR